jgi:hypothetical protein
MSITYTPTTNFGSKDTLPANDPNKVIVGAEFTSEFNAIQAAFALAAPTSNPTFSGTATYNNLTVSGSFTSVGIDDNATATAITIDASQNVGIGSRSNTPIASGLTVRGTPGTITFDPDVGTEDYAAVVYHNANQVDKNGLLVTNNWAATTSKVLSVGTTNAVNGTYKAYYEVDGVGNNTWSSTLGINMTLTNQGKLGIGETSPYTSLHVTNAAPLANCVGVFESGTDETYLNFRGPSSASTQVRVGMRGNGVSLVTNSTERLFIDSSGDTTLATGGQNTTTSRKLKWSGSGFDRADITVTNVSTFAADMHFSTGNNANYNKRMTIDNLGRIGIGTETPSGKLHTVLDASHTWGASWSTGTAAFGGSLGTSGAFGISYNDTDGAELGAIVPGSAWKPITVLASEFSYNGSGGTSPLFKVNGTGNMIVSVGNNEPAASGTMNTGMVVQSGAGSRALNMGASNTGGYNWINSAYANNSSVAANLVLMTGAQERARITGGGFLLVGTDTPVSGYSHLFESLPGDVTFRAYRPATGATNSIAVFASDVGGVGTAVCAVRVDGDLENVNNSYGALSDARLKSNIVDASPQLDDIMAVKVRNYTLDSTGDTHIGVVAQELEEAGMHGLVNENEDGIKSVKYSLLYMKAIKAMQEQQAMIEALAAKVEALENA